MRKKIWRTGSKLLCLLLVFLLLPSLGGCGVIRYLRDRFFFDEYADLPPYEIGKEFVYSRDLSAIEEKMTEVRFLIAQGTDYAAFELLYTTLRTEDAAYLSEQTEKYALLRDLDGSNTEWQAGYTHCLNFERNFALWLIETEELLAASAFRPLYYEGLTDAQVEAHVSELKGMYSEEEKALQERIEMLEENYGTDGSDAMEAYVALVRARNELAVMNGYGDYATYAHAVLYGRDYGKAEIDRLLHYVQQYVCALSQDVGAHWAELEAAQLHWGKADRDAYTNFFYRGFHRYGAKKYLDAYADAVGGELCATYDALWQNGYCFYGNDTENSYQGAYQGYFEAEGVPYLYFGPYYQDVMTVTHELGHYYHATKGNNRDYDLLELHSQGNEMLFLAYLGANGGALGLSETCLTAILTRQYADMLDSVVIGAAMYEFELRCYEATDLQPESAREILDNVMQKYGISNEEYILDNAAVSPLYYISYAVSGVSALTLGAAAQADFAGAVALYESLCSVEDESGFIEALRSVGMDSPFEEKAYLALRASLSEYANGQKAA
ncbi:MAG: hypothetical protein E7590_02705 [Ruminococcaceae bacterium]|nr:hypothetical protein [Oscillospiraceae bacterium]